MIKYVLLTGGSGGIGSSILNKLLKEPMYHIIVTYRKDEQLSLFESMGYNRITPLRADLTEADDIKTTSEAVKRIVGKKGLYALINCAGLADATPLAYASEKKARDLMEVNYFTPMMLTKYLLNELKVYSHKNDVGARVLNVTSWAGVVAQPFIPFYNASKFAIMGFSESIYYDLKLDGIHVVSVIPGITITPLLSKTTSSAFEAISTASNSEKEKYEKNFSMFANDPSQGPMARFLSTSDQAANRIIKILDKKRPKARYSIANDAKVMDVFVAKLLPTRLRLGMMKRMYGLKT
ncbi:SDR family NAD(P)-dependent oxidoreductase [Acidaminobacter sp. JC074]|uniref:SDR family NAD(P)-dependent oxidoreductase n=1 Tax=Acidaminobacter sp. JC074 TaxID=2530199 RepID=UPI001F0E025F|nr:SDR family NAD(P)-dependent oxidoreductase [Acidaminobacter sp. JC074]MCH4886135.1 SDR family NAD(P)-dependent oxidoreductase [Acidaminobacter sp. JC074]